MDFAIRLTIKQTTFIVNHEKGWADLMARGFVGNNTTYLQLNSLAATTTTGMTFAAWFKPTVVNADQTILTLCSSTSDNDWWRLGILGGSTALLMDVNSSGGANYTSTTTGTLSSGTWYHGCAVFLSDDTTRYLFLNGGSKATGSFLSAPNVAVVDTTVIGGLRRPTDTNYMNGLIAEACIWNTALADAEAAALATGVRPYLIRPNSLVGYWPLFGLTSLEPDFSGRQANMVVTGATAANHAPITLMSVKRPLAVVPPERYSRIVPIPASVMVMQQ